MDWTWDLTVLYKDFDDPKIEEDFASLQRLCGEAKEMLQGETQTALENAADAMEEISRLSSALGMKNPSGQNVIVQSIGACSGSVVAGAIFTLPAIYILGLDINFNQMVFSSLLGGVLGILFMIPFRRYFVREMDGKMMAAIT